MFLTTNSNLNKLSYGFGILFIAIGGIQQYLTPYFKSLGEPNIGFNILLIIYISIFISNFLASFFINKFGVKKLLIATAFFYLLSMVLILFTNEYIAYLGAMILGIAGAILWNSQNGYLLKISNEKNRGESSGFFISIFEAGSLLGILILGFFVEIYGFKISFMFVLLIGFLSLVLFIKLDETKICNQSKKTFYFSFKTPTLFKVSIINAFSYNLIYGLSFSLVPLHIYILTNNTFIVAIISSLFYLFPMLLSKKIGLYSDKQGRNYIAFLGTCFTVLGLLFFHFSNEIFVLIIASILLALSVTFFNPIFIAIQGDISTSNTQVYITNIFMLLKYIGIITGIALGMLLGTKLAYMVTMILVVIGYLLGYKLMLDMPLLKRKVEKEINIIIK